MIQWTVTLDGMITSGALLTVVGVLVRVLWSASSRFTKIDDKLEVQDLKLSTLSGIADKISDALTSIAVQKARIDQHEKMIDELRHGEGKVLPFWKGAHEHP